VCSCFDECWSFGVAGLEWNPCCRLKPATRIPPQPSHTSFACCINKVTDIHSEYAILFASPHEQWLLERVSVLLRYTYVACAVVFCHGTQTRCGFLALLFLAFPVLSSLHVTRPIFQARRVTPLSALKFTARLTIPAIRNAWSCTCTYLTLCAASALTDISRSA